MPELLAADMPPRQYRLDPELEYWKGRLGVGAPRFPARAQPALDLSHPAMAVNLDACIQCARCRRACREEQGNDVIGFAVRGARSKSVFDFDDPMGDSTCLGWGECVQACPTAALMPAGGVGLVQADRTVDSVCPSCGAGCQPTYHVKPNPILRVEGGGGPANRIRLCVKGRFGLNDAENPAMSDPDLTHARPALESPGQAKPDRWIIQAMARRPGLDWQTAGPRAALEEIRRAMPSTAGITWERLEREGAVTYPCEREGDSGTAVVFTERFPTPTGKGRFVPAHTIPAGERPDAEYPLVLITGRQLEHWHTGAVTRRASVLDAIEPLPVASSPALELAAMAVTPGEVITRAARRGPMSLYARADTGTPRGSVFMPFCFFEAAASRLTNPALEPFGKIPEFKDCATRIEKGGSIPPRLPPPAG